MVDLSHVACHPVFDDFAQILHTGRQFGYIADCKVDMSTVILHFSSITLKCR